MNDLISRKAVIDYIMNAADGYDYIETRTDKMIEDIKRIPSAEPERKKGRWLEHNPHKWGLGIVYECSECGEKIECEPSNFCPSCGADMRRGGNNERLN